MKIDDLYKYLNNLDYKLMYNRNNFNVYMNENNNIYYIDDLTNLNTNKLINHFKDNDQLIKTHKSILLIQNHHNDYKYIKLKTNTPYIDYPILDLFIHTKMIKYNKKYYLYSTLKNIPFKIKENQCLEFVTYIENGTILFVLDDFINLTKIKIFLINFELNVNLTNIFIKNLVYFLKELKNV